MLRKLIIIALSSLAVAKDLALVAITHHSCPVCKLWHEQVAPYYVFESRKSSLPELREYDIANRAQYEWVASNVPNVLDLPTFVLMEDGEEKVRFSGYRGYQAFFEQLSVLLTEIQ